MWQIASCLLLAASTLGARQPYRGIQTFRTPQNYAPTGSVYPIDYNDELTITNPMIKPGNIIFNFEQVRRDQPSIVDAREEDIGKYMNRRHRTTTTTTTSTTTTTTPAPTTTMAPAAISNEEIDFQVPVSKPIQTRFNFKEDMHPVMLAMGTTEIPRIASFHDFSIPLDIPDSSRINAKVRYPYVDNWNHKERNTAPPEENLEAQPHPQPAQASWDDLQSREEAYQAHIDPSRVTVSRTTEAPTTTPQVHRHHNHPGGRGSHRFSWDDVESSQVPTLAPVPYKEPTIVPATTKLAPPPPVPTLTPWEGDNF